VVSAASSIVMDLARQRADSAGTDVQKFLGNRQDLNKILDDLKTILADKLSELLKAEPTKIIAAKIRTIAATGAVHEVDKPEVEWFNGQWEDQKEGLNTITGFASEVVKALTKYGYILRKADEETDEANEEDPLGDQDEEQSKEHIY